MNLNGGDVLSGKTKQNNKIYKEKRKKSGDKEQREIYMLFFEATLTMPETI